MSWLLTDKGKIYFRSNTDQLEDRPLLILLHGAGSDSRVWTALFPLLKEDISVVTPDLPGHGKSEGKAASDLSEYLWIVDALSEEFRAEKFFLGGHSMGGAITLLYSIKNREKLMGSIIIASSSTLPVNPQLFDVIQNNFELTASLSTQFSFSKSGEDVDFYREMTTQMIKENGSETLYIDMKACDNYSVEKELNTLTMPKLLLAGEKDRMVSIKNIEEFYSQLPDPKELKIFSEAGHMVILEEPEGVSSAIKKFVLSAH